MVFSVDEVLEKSKSNAFGVSFEEALKRTSFGRFHYCLIFISGVFMASVFFETMGINYVLPVAECDLNLTSKQQYGIVSGVWFAGIILTSHLWGFLSDNYGRKKILIIASLTAFAASVLSSLAVNLWQMVLFRLLNGLCISGASSPIFAYLGEFLGAKNRSRSMMAGSVIFALFCMFLPIQALLIINQSWSFVIPIIGVVYKPWRLFLLTCGVPSLLCGLVLTVFPESPKYTFSQGDESKTLAIFKKIYFFNTRRRDYPVFKIKPNEEFEGTQNESNVLQMMYDQSKTLFRYYPRSIGIISALQFGTYFVCNGMLLFFPDILNQTASHQRSSGGNAKICEIVEDALELRKNGKNDQACVEELDVSAYYYAIILEACYLVGFFIVSILVNFIGRLAIFTFIFFTTGLCAFLMVFISNPSVSVYLYVWLLVSGINNTLLNTVTYELFPTNLRSLAMSFSLMCGRLASLAGGNIAGFMLEGYCDAMWILCGAIMIVSGILTFFIPNIIKKK